MDKCQQFIDKVGELRFLKIKEIQVNKFNRLLLEKLGNITWFNTVPHLTHASNPQASNTSQGDSAVPPQAECTDAKTASTSPLAVSTNSQAELANAQAASASTLAVSTNSQGVSAASPQGGSSQAIQTGSGTNSQGDGTVPPQAGTSWAEGADAQAASTSLLTVSTNS